MKLQSTHSTLLDDPELMTEVYLLPLRRGATLAHSIWKLGAVTLAWGPLIRSA